MDEGSEGGDGSERPEQEVAATGPDGEAKSSCALAVGTSRLSSVEEGSEVFWGGWGVGLPRPAAAKRV